MGRRKKVRLEQIAEAVGSSIVTVSNALNDRKGVSEELRSLIKEKAKEMGYEASETPVQVKNKSYTIGVIVAERYVKEYPSFYMEIYKCIAQEATKRGNMTILEVAGEKKEKLEQEFNTFQDIDIEGIIIIGEMNRDYVNEVRKVLDLPIVCVDFYDVSGDIDYIVTDNFGGMEQMTEILLKAGCEDLIFVGTPQATGSIMDRYLGFTKAMTKWKKKVDPAHVIPDRDENRYGYKIDVELPEKLPDGFVCNCDKAAKTLLYKLQERGVSIPEDVSIVSFDHYYSQVQSGIELTTYENDEKVIASISVNTLIKRIEGGKHPKGIRIVEGRVIQGNTVKERKN
mgnify:FL=1